MHNEHLSTRRSEIFNPTESSILYRIKEFALYPPFI